MRNGRHWYDFNNISDETNDFVNVDNLSSFRPMRNGNGLKRGYKDLDDYFNNRYDYEPNGRGWNLKDEQRLEESIRRSIRKYLH